MLLDLTIQAAAIENKKRERFERMAVRLAHHLSLSKAEEYKDLPIVVRQQFEGMQYCDIILPLMRADHLRGASVRSIANKYGIGKTTVSYHLNKKCPNC